MDDLKDKVALVTGASAGIGLAVARALAAEGARVAMVARTRATLEEAARAVGPRARAFPCDVSDLSRLAALAGEVVAAWGGIDILVNNAGVNHRGPIATHSAEELAGIITTNLTAPIVLTRVCADHLRSGGAIVNVASLAGMFPVHHEATYSASKFGLRAFTLALAEEMAERGIKVSSVCPGPVDTGFFGDEIEHVPDLVFSQPISSAEQVARAVLDCIHDGTLEVAVPPRSGRMATLGYVFPGLARVLRPAMTRRGAKNKRRFIDSKKR